MAMHDHRIDRYCDRLTRRGFNLLGEGYFSRVFTHPGDPAVVIKVGPLSDGWLLWASYCRSNRGRSPFLLKVHKVRRFERLGVYIAVVERCNKTAQDSGIRWEAGDVLRAYRWDNPQSDSITADRRARVERLFPGLPALLKTLSRYAKENGLDCDLHHQNAMFRADGSLCLTDPFSGGTPAALKRAA